jgi:Tfp pilus assembly protein PilX
MRDKPMIPFSRKNGRHSESGVALLIVIFTLMLITAIGAGMIMLTNTETNTSSNFRDEQTALFGAKAGIEETRDRFRSVATNSLSASLPAALPGQTNGVLYILNPTNAETDTPWVTNGTHYPDTEICGEMTNIGAACAGSPAVPGGSPWYTTTTASSAYAASPVMSWKWTRVNLKTNKTSSGTTAASTVDGVALHSNYLVCWTGSNEIATPLATCSAAGPGYLPVYVMTTLAVTPSGSRRMIQAEATATTFPILPGPMIFDGANPTFSAPSSAAFGVTGTDQSSSSNPNGPKNGASCPTPQNEPALGGYNAASVLALSVDASSRPSSYTGATGTGSPSVSNVSTSLGNLNTVGGLEALVSQVTNSAASTNVYNGNASSITNPGTATLPVINVVTGDLSLSGGFTGAGILLVEGNLTISGNPSYSGLILVIGKGSVTKNGGGNGTLDGSLLVANLFNSSNQLLPSSSAPGAPTINWNGGGTATIQYDSCWSSAMSQSLAYRIVAVREMMY